MSAKKCKECKLKFIPTTSANKFCSKYCCDRYHNNLNMEKSTHKARSKGSLGAAVESIICGDLLLKGFDVYRAVTPNALCDLVIIKDKEVLRVEVKTCLIYQKTGRIHYASPNPENYDILALYHVSTKTIIYNPEIE